MVRTGGGSRIGMVDIGTEAEGASAARHLAGRGTDMAPHLRKAPLLQQFRETVTHHGGREAVRYFDASITHADLDRLSDGFAGWLAAKGVGAGDRLGVLLQNVPHMLIANLAAWKLGAIPVPGNPMYRSAELAAIFADYRPSAVVRHDDHAAEVDAALQAAGLATTPCADVSPQNFQRAGDIRVSPPPPTAVASGEDFLSCCAAGGGWAAPARAALGEEAAFILYTSGTTGRPKGAVLTHANLAFTIGVGAAWQEIGPASRILGLAPLFHITGYVLHMAVTLATGCSLGLSYRFHPEATLSFIRDYRPTYTIAATTAFNALMNAPGATAADFASFQRVSTGGAPMAPALQAELRRRLGIMVLPAYGMTETCSPALLPPPDARAAPHDPETGALAAGVPIPFTEVRIAGPGGEALGPGLQGEIWMRGPHIMAGYWNKPAETAEALEDGWMKSGDIGFRDAEGWVYVVDRLKNMINASGFKVWPREVEDVLLEHPAVREAAVVGAPDTYRGETVRAYVSLVPGAAALEPEVLIRHCRDRLAAYKAPREIVVMDELPKTPTGKIQHAALRLKA